MSALTRTTNLNVLKREMSEYYQLLRYDTIADNQPYNARRSEIEAIMEDFIAKNPTADAYTTKAKLYETITDKFEPMIFPHSPFFYEMGMRTSENWGVAHPQNPGSWLYLRNHTNIETAKPQWESLCNFQVWNKNVPAKLWSLHGGFDTDHHCLGYTRLLKIGVNGILTEIKAKRQSANLSSEQLSFLNASEIGCNCLLKIAKKFADKANQLLTQETDPQAKHFLQMIARAAVRIPANPPETLYEGLAMLWFMREVSASLECIGISVIGHVDKYLIDLYRADLKAKRITKEEAADLLARWMLPTDIKFHSDDSSWPETSTCLMLGGCDDEGKPLYNELTKLIIDTHCEHKLLNPKLNCRYSSNSPQEYLDLISEKILAGHNNFALLNDDSLIPATMKAGKTLEHARRYVNGGCQETMVEGEEHSAGAYYYFNMSGVINYCLDTTDRSHATSESIEVLNKVKTFLPDKILTADSFEDFYSQFMTALKHFIALGTEWSRHLGENWQNINPCPIFSSSIDGCIERAADYSSGAARYNPSGIALVGLATLADSLLAIREIVFKQKKCTYAELLRILKNNWAGEEQLRQDMIDAPKFGHENSDADAFTTELAKELAAFIRTQKNERGDYFQPSLFVYYAFKYFSDAVQATPDGRCDGDLLSQGTAPSRVRYPQSITQILNSMSKVDYSDFPGNAVLDLQLPAGNKISKESLSALMLTFAKMKLPTLQPNCTDVNVLRDAVDNPQNHRDLTVRISGLSAKFVCLNEDVQQEIISRIALAS